MIRGLVYVEYQPDSRQKYSTGGVIRHIIPDSIAADLGLKPGDAVLAVGDLALRDIIDYRFATAEEQIEMLVQTSEELVLYDIEKDSDEDLGIEFVEPLFDRLRTCNNKCPFCFLTQMPKGMRKSLYLKDDDYRLSFLYGNFVTLTNLSEDDWQRIESQRLSPLHISVHATDQELRAILLGKKDVPDVLAQIERLAAAGIEVHTQVVACPELNDGESLHRTVRDLAAYFPVVQSIAVVPVGLTRFRFQGKAPQSIRAAIQVHETPEWLDSNWERQPLWSESAPPAQPAPAQPAQMDWGYCARMGAATDVPLRCYTPDEAARVIDSMLPYQDYYRRELGTGLVYPSDEFFLLCGRDLPPDSFYDDYPQYSNGVGMTRDLLDSWAQVQRHLPVRLEHPTSIALVCGTLIAPTMQYIVDRLNRVDGLNVRLLPVVNQFFGETVTVSGLLMGQDVVPALRDSGCAWALLPRVMFDYQGMRTLDEYSPERIAEESQVQIRVVDDMAELVASIRQCGHTASPSDMQTAAKAVA
jgi:NifB/MoaA-like Fe-S oxidoreductase